MDIQWKKIGNSDYKFISGDYLLRVEKLNHNIWWWSFNYKGEEIASFWDGETSIASTEKEAKLLAENKYLKHLNENK